MLVETGRGVALGTNMWGVAGPRLDRGVLPAQLIVERQPGHPQLVSLASAGLPRRPMLIMTVAARMPTLVTIFMLFPPLCFISRRALGWPDAQVCATGAQVGSRSLAQKLALHFYAIEGRGC